LKWKGREGKERQGEQERDEREGHPIFANRLLPRL